MPDLYGYGPHALGAGQNYEVKCVEGAPNRNKQLTIGIDISAGNILVHSRKKGSAAAFEVQSYKKADETLAAAAIAADASIRVDCTNKDIRLVTAALTVAVVDFAVDNEA